MIYLRSILSKIALVHLINPIIRSFNLIIRSTLLNLATSFVVRLQS